MARRRSPERREELLAAGEQVFRDQGTQRATIEQITAVAGVAKGTFYLYFRSKNELVVALRQRFAENLAEAVSAQRRSDGDDDWFGLLRRQLGAVAGAFVAQAPLHEAAFHDDLAEHGAEREEAWAEQVVESLTLTIRAGSAAGAFAVDDPELSAVALFHAIFGLFHHVLHHPEDFDRERVLATAWHVVSRVLSGEAPSPSATDSHTGRAKRARA
jgi:AcrR family transcriptional regulator